MIDKEKDITLTKAANRTEVTIEVVEQPGGIYQVYANHVIVSYTGHDVLVNFSQLRRLPEIKASDMPTSRVEQRAAVTMAWSEAKALRDLLTGVIQLFESANGQVNPTPTVP